MNTYDLLKALYLRSELVFFRSSNHGQEFLDHQSNRVMYGFYDDEKVSDQVKNLLERHLPKNGNCSPEQGTGEAVRDCMAFMNEIIRQSSREQLDEVMRLRPHEAKAENWEDIWLEQQATLASEEG